MKQGPHAPTELIADYAAGALSPGMSLLVASHLSYCACCGAKAAALEAVGGALLAAAEPVAPSPRCLAKALARIGVPEMCERRRAAREEPLPPLLRMRIDQPGLRPALAAGAARASPSSRSTASCARPWA